MSLRRSSRTASTTILATKINGAMQPANQTTDGHDSLSTNPSGKENNARKSSKRVSRDEDTSKMMPPPATPVRKRQRVSKHDVKPPPLTPTPSLVGVLVGGRTSQPTFSTGDIDDLNLPLEPRPVEPHHASATLTTPRGTQVTADVHDTSPSKPGHANSQTSTTLLQDATKHLLKADPKLKPLIDRHTCRVFSPEGLAEEIDPFRSLVSAITSQQVSGAAATSIKNKFIALFPADQCPNGFPIPAVVAATDIPRLRTAGLSQRKAEYIQGLAAKFASGELTVQMLLNGSDEQVMEKLVAVRGLGVWSVEMFMCFALKRMDILSTGDLGVQRGMAAYIGKDVAKLKAKGGGKWKYMSEADMLSVSEKFRPYRSLFMWYMWRIEDVDTAAVEQN